MTISGREKSLGGYDTFVHLAFKLYHLDCVRFVIQHALKKQGSRVGSRNLRTNLRSHSTLYTSIISGDSKALRYIALERIKCYLPVLSYFFIWYWE